eukprot:g1311.t1
MKSCIMKCLSRTCCCFKSAADSDGLRKKTDESEPETQGLLDESGSATVSSDSLTEEQLQRLVDDQMNSLKQLDLLIARGDLPEGSTPALKKSLSDNIGSLQNSSSIQTENHLSSSSKTFQKSSKEKRYSDEVDPSENIAAMEKDLDDFLANMEATNTSVTDPSTYLHYSGTTLDSEDLVDCWSNGKLSSPSSSSSENDKGALEGKGSEVTSSSRRKHRKEATKVKTYTGESDGEGVGFDGIVDC